MSGGPKSENQGSQKHGQKNCFGVRYFYSKE
jgi:hypothetical protein